jgi:hypothetical protein
MCFFSHNLLRSLVKTQSQKSGLAQLCLPRVGSLISRQIGERSLKRGKKIPRPRQLKCICAKDTAPIGSQHPVELIQPQNRNDSERKMNF